MRDPRHEVATFEMLADGRAKVLGALDFYTVGALLPQGAHAIQQGNTGVIDLAGVGASDSAGLALLIEWLSIAHAAGRRLRFEKIPAQVRQLASLSEVEDLIAAGSAYLGGADRSAGGGGPGGGDIGAPPGDEVSSAPGSTRS